MKLRHLLISTAFLSLLNALCFIFFPELALQFLGRITNAPGLLHLRYYGALALGWAVLLWGARVITDRLAQRVIAAGITATLAASAMVGLYGVLSGAVNVLGLFVVAIDLSLTLAFIRWLAFSKPNP